jgi:hypothetical protein
MKSKGDKCQGGRRRKRRRKKKKKKKNFPLKTGHKFCNRENYASMCI